MKICSKCKVKKPKTEYKPSVREKSYGNCRECERVYYRQSANLAAERQRRYLSKPEVKERRNKYYQEYPNKEAVRLSKKRSARKILLQKEYGLTLEDYEKILAEQQGYCKICGIHESELSRVLSVDHCHETNEVRGLLCGNCNAGIGLLKDSPDILLKAVNYLRGFTST